MKRAPLATAVAMPAARRLSSGSLSRSLSQCELNAPPPRLMLTAAMSNLELSSSTRSSARIRSEVNTKAHGLGRPLPVQSAPENRENT
mgnify:CR=1 FL=1